MLKAYWQILAVYQPSQEDELLDLEARMLLIESDDSQREKGVRFLQQRYAGPLMGFLGGKFGDLTEDERASVIQDTLLDIYKMASEQTLNVDDPLSGLIFTIAKRRATDARRSNFRRIPRSEKLLEQVGDYLKDTEVGADWKLASSLGRAEEITAEFREFIRTLKAPQQKRIASIMADFLPDEIDNQGIAEEAKRRFELYLSQVEIKGAKQALRTKFREILKRKRI